MKWNIAHLLRSRREAELHEEVRRRRGDLAHAIITNDRKVMELRSVMSGALRLREGRDHEEDR